jgi:hypothetical protein
MLLVPYKYGSELIMLDLIYPKFKIKNKENDGVNDKILTSRQQNSNID